MNTYRLLGATSLFMAGYVAHLTVISDWALRGKIIVAVVVLFFIYVGLAGILSEDRKAFKNNVVNGLNLFSILS